MILALIERLYKICYLYWLGFAFLRFGCHWTVFILEKIFRKAFWSTWRTDSFCPAGWFELFIIIKSLVFRHWLYILMIFPRSGFLSSMLIIFSLLNIQNLKGRFSILSLLFSHNNWDLLLHWYKLLLILIYPSSQNTISISITIN